tara:strand:- start:199 stop:801 length:603 start_codon:yes stop_codon:yes gene_type:complete
MTPFPDQHIVKKIWTRLLAATISIEQKLEIHPTEPLVIRQFSQIQKSFDEAVAAFKMLLEGDPAARESLNEIKNSTSSVVWQHLEAFDSAAKNEDAHTCCRRSRDLHCGMAVLTVISGVEDVFPLFQAVINTIEHQLPRLRSKLSDDLIYVRNISYRLNAIQSFKYLDHRPVSLVVPTKIQLKEFTDARLIGLTNYISAS